jgi:hypothetical protein
MDPEACLQAAETALAEGDHEEAREHLENYRSWRSRGGFMPTNGDARERVLRRMLATDHEQERADEVECADDDAAWAAEEEG